MQYIALIYSEEARSKSVAPEQLQAEFAGYMDFNAHARAEGSLLAGDALHDTTTATSVRLRDGEVLVTDGPFAETREALGGFYLLECRDLDHAIALAARIPSAAHGTVEIRPVMMIPDL